MLAVPAFVVAADQNVLLLALPTLAVDLGATAIEQLWISDVYGLLVAAVLIPAGALTDRVGARRVLLAGSTAFAGLSLLAAWSSSVEMLVAARALMGVAGATLGPASLAMIAQLYPDPAGRDRAIGVWMTCFMGGMIVGPVVGGVALAWFWWGSVFLLGIPAMVLLALGGPRLLPVTPGSASAGARLDVLGAALSVAAVLALVLGLKQVLAHGPTGPAMLTVAAGAALAAALVRHLGSAEHPLVPLGLFRNRRLSTALAVMGGCAAAIAGTYLMLTQHLQLVVDLTPLRSAAVVLVPAVLFATGAVAGPALATRLAPHLVLAGGLGVAAAGLGIVVTGVSADDLVLTVAGFSVAYLGFGSGASLGTAVVIGAVPARQAGTAGALSETSTELGQGVGIALLGSVGAVAYRSRLGDAADRAGASLADPGFSATERNDSWAPFAEAAFAHAFEVVAMVAAVLVLVLSLLAAAALRPESPDGRS